jgi:hypothetical protein
MKFPFRKTIAVASLALLAATVCGAAPFVLPSEETPPFRRDQLPIDTDSMGYLSRDMTMLSQTAALDSAPDRRAAAQALALALALDPSNSEARDILSSIAKETRIRHPDEEKLTQAKARIWQFLGWLATPEAGTDGNLLADLMRDSASMLDPGNPSAVALRDSPEQGIWDDWVAPLQEFEEKRIADNSGSEGKKPDEPKKKDPTDSIPKITLTEASVRTVLYAYDKKSDGYEFGNTVLHMQAEADHHDGLEIRIPCDEEEEWQVNEFVIDRIRTALESTSGLLLPPGKITFRAGDGDLYSFRKSNVTITGPAFVLASAAMTGIVPDATVIGVIDENNKLTAPSYVYYFMEKLLDGEGGRLVIPAAAADSFAALLTLEKPEFFLKYEVFVANTPEEFASLCAKSPDKKSAEISARFKEIKDKANGATLGPYLANKFVRQRLLEISAEAPYHLSAKLLAIQGSSQRPPRSLSREMLGAMIWHAIAPLKRVEDVTTEWIDESASGKIDTLYDETRAELDLLDRYTERADRELLERAKKLAGELRDLSKAFRNRGDDDARLWAIQKAWKIFVRSNEEYRKELSLVTGDPLPEDAFDRLKSKRKRDE